MRFRPVIAIFVFSDHCRRSHENPLKRTQNLNLTLWKYVILLSRHFNSQVALYFGADWVRFRPMMAILVFSHYSKRPHGNPPLKKITQNLNLTLSKYGILFSWHVTNNISFILWDLARGIQKMAILVFSKNCLWVILGVAEWSNSCMSNSSPFYCFFFCPKGSCDCHMPNSCQKWSCDPHASLISPPKLGCMMYWCQNTASAMKYGNLLHSCCYNSFNC